MAFSDACARRQMARLIGEHTTTSLKVVSLLYFPFSAFFFFPLLFLLFFPLIFIVAITDILSDVMHIKRLTWRKALGFLVGVGGT